ncbi:MAG: 5-formyltetrahydrofolate cyclo-ligase [Chthoniobacter sp.]|nr:5-formyltetrahydrofolate cyclo-ligase [Chthoniobacter sp.]
MRSRLKTLGDTRAEKSRAIVAAIAAHPCYAQLKPLAPTVSLATRTCDVIALFDPLPSEPDIALLRECDSRTFCYPRLTGETLEFVAVQSLEDLAPAAWNPNIREPQIRDENIVPPSGMDLILVPGLAFTRDGRRLGRGGGYYDRLLAARAPHTVTLGICFDLQIVSALPTEPHDQCVDAVITESGLLTR